MDLAPASQGFLNAFPAVLKATCIGEAAIILASVFKKQPGY